MRNIHKDVRSLINQHVEYVKNFTSLKDDPSKMVCRKSRKEYEYVDYMSAIENNLNSTVDRIFDTFVD